MTLTWPVKVMTVEVVKAIMGWTPLSLGKPNLGTAYVTLKGMDLAIGLCGHTELIEQPDPRVLENMVAVQCGGGRWTTRLQCLPKKGFSLRNLTRYTTFKGSYGGVLPELSQSYDMTFDNLIREFRNIWDSLTLCADPKVVLFLQGWAARVARTSNCLPNVGRPRARLLRVGSTNYCGAQSFRHHLRIALGSES